uniref:Transcriptional regulator SLK2 n=1 Tax=Brassica campestris TaxID=3711 RepID=M4D1V8_BRACM
MNKPGVDSTTDGAGHEALNMQRNSGINNMRIPTPTPMSFSSNNINIPGSLVIDGSASMQQHLSQQQQQQAGQSSVPMRENDYSHVDKKPRIEENCISYWRKFVAEYFSPRAKQRLCLSQYESAGHHALGMFQQAAPDMWQCDLCSTKSGKGFEATFDVLARLIEIKFASGIIDELLYLDHPREHRFTNGLMMLEYRKAVQETVHEQFRVVREGHLRIIFSQDLKILTWEFCARRHEELLLRRLIAPQVNQLLQVAQKCQNTISESGSEGVSQQDLQSNSNMVLGAGRQLAKFMELQSLNDLGYPKRYIRTLQISEVVKSMKDLMNFTGEHKVGPIEGLRRLLEQTATSKLQRQKVQEMEHMGNNGAMNGSAQAQMALTPGTMNGLIGNNNSNSSNSNNHHQLVGRGAMNGSAQAAAALTNYQSMLMRQNAMNNPNSNAVKEEGFSTQNPTQSPSSSSHQRQNLATPGFPSSPQMQQQQQQQQRNMNGPPHHLQPPHSHGNNQGQQMLNRLLQEISENGPSLQQQQAFSGQSGGGNNNAERNPAASTSSISGGGGRVPSRNNSFKAVVSNNNNHHLPEDLSIPELSHDFSEDAFFNNSDIYGSL